MASNPADTLAIHVDSNFNVDWEINEPGEDYALDEPQRLSPDGAAAFALNREGRIVSANEPLAELLHCSIQHLQNRDFIEFVPPAYHEACRSGFDDVAAGAMRDFTLTIIRADGQRRVASLTCLPGKPVARAESGGVVGLLRDITVRRQNQRRKTLARKALEHTLEAIVVLDRQLRLIFANSAFTRITGYRDRELVGLTPEYLLTGNHERDTYATLLRTLSATGQWRGELWCRRRNGEHFPSLQSFAAMRDKLGNITHYVHCFNDISQHKDYERRLAYLAHRDPVTHLPNRSLFAARCAAALQNARRTGTRVSVLFIDLDHFKAVNDEFGHHTGDLLLQMVAERLTGTVRATDTVARFGGDEFVILLENISQPNEASAVAEKLIDAITGPFFCSDKVLRIGASIGISCHPEGGEEADALLRQADAAMYNAKKSGRSRYCLSQAPVQAKTQPLSKERLAHAILHGDLELRFLPIADLREPNQIVGVVPQANWRPDNSPPVAALRLQRIADRGGLAADLDAWVLKATLAQLDAMPAAFPLAVWIPLTSLRGGQFSMLLEQLSQRKRTNSGLTILISQRAALEQPVPTRRAVTSLVDTGVSAGMAEFGNDPLPLSQIASLPLSSVMLARELYRRHTTTGESAKRRLKAAVTLAKSLNLTTLGVYGGGDNRATLIEAGCHLGRAQGVSNTLSAKKLGAKLSRP